MKFLICIYIVVFSFLFSTPFLSKVSAQQKNTSVLKVSPVIFNNTLTSGNKYDYTVTVENLLSQPLPLKVSLQDFEPKDEEQGYDLNEDEKHSEFLSWITIDEPNLLLNAHEKKEINFHITIPRNVKVDSFYTVLFLQPLFPNTGDYSSLVSTKLGVLILTNVGNLQNNKAEILTFNHDKFIYDSDPISVDYRVKNTGVHFFVGKPIIYIKPLFGEEYKVQDLEEKFIFPNKARYWRHTIQLPHYWQGIYKVTLGISTGNGSQIFKSRYIIAFPYKIVIGLAVLIVLAMLIRRHQMKSRVIRLKNN